jgi:Family of unknown function (DUF6194)
MHMNETLEDMSIDEITGYVGGLGDVLVLRPRPGDGSPEISWGDTFFYYAPDGAVPKAGQPFATIVTKDYPGDEGSRLSRPGAFRLNIAAGQDAFTRWTGREPREPAAADADPGPTDADPGTTDADPGTTDADPGTTDADPGTTDAEVSAADPGAADTVLAHPVYGGLGWLAVVNPGPRTEAAVRDLLRTAHDLARSRHQRRAAFRAER